MINKQADARIRFWRLRAEELRTLSEATTDPVAAKGMRSAAQTYDILADRAEAGREE
ncbi:MAG TPA: hypothetical protein VJR47_05020 [Stellaceae bacterium]|nr:hypothetical protein [Stellaceae bacterium]